MGGLPLEGEPHPYSPAQPSPGGGGRGGGGSNEGTKYVLDGNSVREDETTRSDEMYSC